MKKRFALIVAAGLVTVLIAGSAALSLGLLGAAPAAGDRAAPRVRTIHHTVTVHRKARPSTRTVVLSATPGGSSVASSESESEVEFEGHEASEDGRGGSEAFDD